MNAKTLAILTLAFAAAGSAIAETPTIVSDSFNSSRMRAEVIAELQSYKQAGVNPWSTSYNPLRGFKSEISRQQVVADYLAARTEVAARTGEDSGAAYLAQAVTPRRVTGTTLAGGASELNRN